MSSFYWQILSEIFLGIGIVLLLTAILIAARFRIISGLVSELRAGRNAPAPVMAATSEKSIRSGEADVHGDPGDGLEEGEITVVVAPKSGKAADDSTVVVGSGKDDFRITHSILVISGDPDVIDNNGRRI